MSKRRFQVFGLANCTKPGLFCSVVRKNRKIPDKQIQRKRVVASAMIPLNLNNASYKSGTKLTNVMNNAMLDKYDPVTGVIRAVLILRN